MTDQQIIAIAIAIAIPAASVIYSNSRITDAKETLRAELQTLRTEMQRGFERIEHALKVHELEHHPK